MSDNSTHIGTRLKQARMDEAQRRGHSVTQGDLEKASGVKREYISMVERQLRDSLQPKATAMLADYLHCDYWWLQTGETIPPRSLLQGPSSKVVLEIIPDPQKLDDYIEIATEIKAVSEQLITNAQSKLPVIRLVKSLTTLCNEFSSTVPTKPVAKKD